ncbi:response regulator transcription factor [Streptomyces sp. MB09-01]|uniref:response regulator transcription factor n=1 Tax=Streptomyces sp. MB09-01 TaxID=3028666 RepID=UPI0029B71D2B|nr:response regulator transcription factor [Streptomyces sp. MB09-01]MDX3537352.1 response regulator transcription factor [Streptomyces sp. MB09-01]
MRALCGKPRKFFRAHPFSCGMAMGHAVSGAFQVQESGREWAYMLILVVTSDREFSVEVARDLKSGGHRVEEADGLGAVLARSQDVDAVLFDLSLSGTEGFEVCRAIRSASSVPLIVTDVRDDEFDRVLCFKLGVDDFVVRPCAIRELVVRLEAVVRRVGDTWQPWKGVAAPSEQISELGPVRIGLRSRVVTVYGREVALTRKEFDILALLASAPGRVFTREDIMREVWGHDGAGDTRTLGVHMVGLRRKLGIASLVETVRGIGFRLSVTRPARVGAPEGGLAVEGRSAVGQC